MTVQKHIYSYLKEIKESIGQPTFRTSDISNLSFESVNRFGKYLGSTSSYERAFRSLRANNTITVKKLPTLPRQRQASWLLVDIT